MTSCSFKSCSTAYTLIEDIAWQVQPQAVVQVDPIQRIITLARSDKRGM